MTIWCERMNDNENGFINYYSIVRISSFFSHWVSLVFVPYFGNFAHESNKWFLKEIYLLNCEQSRFWKVIRGFFEGRAARNNDRGAAKKYKIKTMRYWTHFLLGKSNCMNLHNWWTQKHFIGAGSSRQYVDYCIAFC